MRSLDDLINSMNLFEPDESAILDEDNVVERITAIKPTGKTDSGMGEER